MGRGLGLPWTWARGNEQDFSGRRWKQSPSGQRKQPENKAPLVGLAWQGLFSTYSVDLLWAVRGGREVR